MTAVERLTVARRDAAWEAELVDPVLAAEAERSRLADQLHSGLLQSLVVVRHAIAREQARPVSAAPGLPTADEALADCLAEARRLVWHLRPRTLEAGIAPALDELAHRIADDRRVHLQVDVSAVEDLTAPQAAVVYRVVQAVALSAAEGSPLAVGVSASSGHGRIEVRLVGGLDDADVDVAEWVLRAATYGVAVELVRP